MVVFADGGGEAEMLDLPPIGVCGDGEPSRRWQSGARQRREIRRLGTDSICVGAIGGGEGENECAHRGMPMLLRSPSSWPDLFRPSRLVGHSMRPGITGTRRFAPGRWMKRPGSTSSHVIAVAGQWIDNRNLLHRKIGDDLDGIFVHDQHFLDPHTIVEFFSVLRFERESHSLFYFDRMIERPNARNDRRIVLG